MQVDQCLDMRLTIIIHEESPGRFNGPQGAGGLVAHAIHQQVDTKVVAAMHQRLGAPSGDDAHDESRFHQHADAQAVTHVEDLGLLTGIIVDHLTRREHAVDV